MSDATPTTPASTTVILKAIADLNRQMLANGEQFRERGPTPLATLEFEQHVAGFLRECGRVTCEAVFNDLEPDGGASTPKQIRHADETYRRRGKSRKAIATSFGSIELRRCLYECLEPGEDCIFPLEMDLGLEAQLATPALAERVGRLVADHEQAQVLRLLAEENNVKWSVDSLRKCSASLHEGLAGFREPAQVAKLLEALRAAEESKGQHRPTLSCGRDGVMVPIRQSQTGDREASTATVSVLDRAGKRVTTVYLGRMPEAGQTTLTAELTALLRAVLVAWHAAGQRLPRLSYVTDGGGHQRTYYRDVLLKMANPWQPGTCLQWQWVVDFYHACQHLWDVAAALFGSGKKANRWYRKMRHRLRHQRGGIANVLRSASQHRNRRQLGATRNEAFWKAYRYLRRHAAWMKYAKWRAAGLPIGSGVTEAACKTVFAQRLKRSGMKWTNEGGAVVIGLRVLALSGIWPTVFRERLQKSTRPKKGSSRSDQPKLVDLAA